MYEVWRAQKAGEAELAQADQNRQIAVAQARAKAESAHFEADAEITRANEIIGKSLEGNEAYLRYLWINGLEQNKNAVIYVPTEGSLPIFEAGRPTAGRAAVGRPAVGRAAGKAMTGKAGMLVLR